MLDGYSQTSDELKAGSLDAGAERDSGEGG
jgi:hypothetical protein